MSDFRFDDRERSLVETFRRRVSAASAVPVSVAVERLALGDVIVTAGNVRVVVERKILTDLVASVFDGRLAEQHRRLVEYQRTADAAVWVVVLVEGALTAETFRRSAQLSDGRYRLCVGTQLRLAMESRPDERRLFLRTSSEEETAEVLLALHHRAAKAAAEADGGGGGRPYGSSADPTAAPTPPLLPGRVRGPVFVRQLAATVGVSAARAGRVSDRFGDLRRLTESVAEDPAAAIAALAALLGGRTVALRLIGDLGMSAYVPTPPPHPRRGRKRGGAAAASRPEPRQDDVGRHECDGELAHGGLGTAPPHVPEEEGDAAPHRDE